MQKNLNEETDIAELVERFRRLNGTTSLLQIAMQEEISSVIGTANHMRDHSNLSEFFRNILRHATVLKSIAIEHGA